MSRRLPVPRSAGGWSWALLAALLLGLLVGAATFDRTSSWPTLMGDEATYLMQAESLAWDLDLVYSREDFDRFVRHWGRTPEGLILQKGRSSERLVYGKPFFYAAWTAPFARLSPTGGPFVANALLLAFAAFAAARTLRRSVGPTAPLWVALLVFASVTFAHVFWAHIDLFLACCTALGLALVFGARVRGDGEEAGGDRGHRLRGGARWFAAGLLLAVVAFSRPLYATLFLPAALAALGSASPGPAGRSPRKGRFLPLGFLAAGALLLGLGAAGVHESLAGSWTSYGAERRGFTSVVGFPLVDLPASAWDETIREWGNSSWLQRQSLVGQSVASVRLWAWNGLYYLAGRSVGVLPYFLPVVLGLLAWPRGPSRLGPERWHRWARWGLLAAVLLTAAGFLLVRPFNFYGGGGALANRYFLPVYPALWYLAARPLRPVWLLLVPVLAAPFLWPVWSAPRAYPVDERGVYHYVSAAAREVLPFETSQDHLKPGGQVPEVEHRGLWLKPLDPELSAPVGGGPLVLHGPGPASLLVGRDRPLAALDLEVEDAIRPLRIEGGRVIREEPGRAGWHRLRVELSGPRAVHPMWWTRENFHLYRLTLDPTEDLERSFAFTLTPVGAPSG